MTVSADPSTVTATTPAGATPSAEFGRTALAILIGMVLLIVALTGILVETTWAHPAGVSQTLPPDPGSFARR
jgi:hypothetical protein